MAKTTRPVQSEAGVLEMLETRRLFSNQSAGPAILLNDPPTAAGSFTALAPRPNGGFTAVWHQSGTAGALHQQFDSSGNPINSSKVNPVTTYSAEGVEQVASDAAGNYVLAWGETVQGVNLIAARLFDAAGQPRTDRFYMRQGGNDQFPAVAMADNGRFVVAWVGANLQGVCVQRFAADGTRVGSIVQQLNTTTVQEWACEHPTIAMTPDGNSFVVAWDEPRRTNPSGAAEVRQRRMNWDGTATAPDIAVGNPITDPQERPSLSIDAHGHVVTVWTSNAFNQVVWMRGYDDLGAALGPATAVSRPTRNDGIAYVGLDDNDRAVVTWTVGLGSNRDVYARQMAINGTPISAEFLANASYRTGDQRATSVLVQNDAFLIGYTGNFPAPANNVLKSGVMRFNDASSAPPIDLASATFELQVDFGLGTMGQQVRLTFDGNLGASVQPEDVKLTNRTTGQTVTAFDTIVTGGDGLPSITVLKRPASSSAPLVFPDGNWRLTIDRRDFGDVAGNPLAHDVVFDFYALAGDANRDRHVDEADRAILDAHFGQTSGGTFANGDFNYDGKINAADRAILDANWHVWLPEQGVVTLPATTGDDVLTLHPTASELQVFTGTNLVTPALRIPLGAATSFIADGGAGNDRLMLLGTAAANIATIEATTLTIDGVTISYSGFEARSFDLAGGGDVVTIGTGASFSTRTFQSLASLTIAANGALDLNDNDLRVTNTPRATIEGYIATACNYGGWDGPGGIFSSTAKDNPTGNTTLGLLSGGEFNDNNGGTFNGVAVNNTDVLVKYTYFGDVDFNGSVDASDYNLIDFGFANHLSGWAWGDADYSGGGVDVSDYNLIDFAFATQTSSL